MPDTLYEGPVIDSHHHLWDLSMHRHPWITGGLPGFGDMSYLQHDYLPADYLRDVGDAPLAGSVHVEAAWDRTQDPVEETIWLETLDKARGVATRYVAYVPLRDHEVERVLEEQTRFPRVVALRETVRWHPDPAKSWTERGLMQDPAWRRGVALLRHHRLALELLMNPYQAEEVYDLARDLPDQIFLVNHCGTPMERDPEGLERWRKGLARMAEAPNVAIKVSNFGAYDPDKTPQSLAHTVMTCIDAFGTDRTMFGTDYPVARRHMSWRAMYDSFRAIIAPLSSDEQRALMHDNARRHYRFD
jgi:predicted TIM-barrel fold metal-dependent hydrolase